MSQNMDLFEWYLDYITYIEQITSPYFRLHQKRDEKIGASRPTEGASDIAPMVIG